MPLAAQAEAEEAASEPPLVTPAITMLKRKQPASSGDSSSANTKRPRIGHALNGMVEKLDDFTDVFREAMTGKKSNVVPVELTPTRKTQAMERAQTLETSISDKRIVCLIDLFQNDVTVADAYLVIKCEGVRKKWVEMHTKDISDDEDTNINPML